jgi:hypothetical protein
MHTPCHDTHVITVRWDAIFPAELFAVTAEEIEGEKLNESTQMCVAKQLRDMKTIFGQEATMDADKWQHETMSSFCSVYYDVRQHTPITTPPSRLTHPCHGAGGTAANLLQTRLVLQMGRPR